ncbi:hypothetical protein EGW08_018283, partial [Elysia chlorotica]
MGNNPSQPHYESEDGPQYRYHETVLREAQSRAPLSEHQNDDEEQFFSAEEGDSSRSVTPERQRSESSSGEEISDIEEESTPPSERVNPQPTQHSCGQCNVSLIQDHDSIGPELGRGSNHSVISSPSVSNTHKRVMSANSLQDDGTSSKRIKLRTKSSPFQPICSGTRQQRLIKQLSESLSPAKRKIPLEDEGESASPHKKALTDSSLKRVRLGYIESSESEEDGVDSRGRSRRKIPKMGKYVSKRGRVCRQSAESSSEEDNHKKLKSSRESDRDDKKSNSDVEVSETDQEQVGNSR